MWWIYFIYSYLCKKKNLKQEIWWFSVTGNACPTLWWPPVEKVWAKAHQQSQTSKVPFLFLCCKPFNTMLHIHLYVLWLSVCVNGKQQICTTVSTWTLIIWFSRSYYRCTYKQEQDCKATKTVQQQDDSTGTDHPVMYTVVYHGQHTCKDNNGVESGTDDSETNDESSSDSRSSISTTCTEAYEHQTSVDDNKPLDKSADLITRNCMYEPFDMAAFAPLDLDSWELDALLRFGA
jgi:hypothetical protein